MYISGQLQDFFYPATYRNQPATPFLQHGDARIHTAFNLNIQFLGNTNFRIPTREPSKVKHVKLFILLLLLLLLLWLLIIYLSIYRIGYMYQTHVYHWVIHVIPPLDRMAG
jgi:hypothetical protein